MKFKFKTQPYQQEAVSNICKVFKGQPYVDMIRYTRDLGIRKKKNESQQIYGLLANSTYFKVEGTELILNTGNYGLFNAQANRGAKAKADYFKNHNVNKTVGYDLHHIVPFAKAQNKSDAVSDFMSAFEKLDTQIPEKIKTE